MSAQAVCRRIAVQRRTATSADLPLLRSLFADSRMELATLSADSRFVLVDMQFRAQRRALDTRFPDAEHDILVVGGTDVGRVVIDRSGPDVRVVDITVALGHRRQGIASAVLAEIADEARAAGREVSLELAPSPVG
jgi:GNAT superfamily N-acetyltransferase